jgi:hypothetical protein
MNYSIIRTVDDKQQDKETTYQFEYTVGYATTNDATTNEATTNEAVLSIK